MGSRVLFLGEGSMDDSGRYLAAVLRWGGFDFDHVPDGSSIPREVLAKRYAAIVLSDYRHANFGKHSEQWLINHQQSGGGLAMIGGWASFTGLVGGYAGSRVEGVLPVKCLSRDDRENYASGAVVSRRRDHPILRGISFRVPPVICGYHRATVRKGSLVLMECRRLNFSARKPKLGPPIPLLVVNSNNHSGRVAAFLTDCAPHWAGGLIDWGTRRVRVQVGRRSSVEVSHTYLKFFSQLIAWVMSHS